MINATIENITINEDELYNRIKAYGPGDGINRASITREDADSIAQYGVREEVFDVPTATDFNDFVAKVDAHLEVVKDPVTEIEITFFYDTERGPGGQIFEGTALTHDGNEIDYYRFGDEREIKRGDTIRIVSRSLGINTTGVIEELDWEPGQVSLSIGSKRYNLLDVVFEEESRRERQEVAFGIERPISFRAETGNPGCVVASNPYVSPRTVGVEIYGSQTEGFTPDRDTLLYKGVSSRVEFQQLIPPNTYYFRARAYDVAGNFSEFTDEVSAEAGYLTRNGLEPNAVDESRLENGAVTENKVGNGAVSEGKIQTGAVTTDKILTGGIVIDDEGEGGTKKTNRVVVRDGGEDKVAMGYINGKPGVPSSVDYGFWGALGTGIFIPGAAEVVTSGYEFNIQTFSSSTKSVGDIVSWIEVDVGWDPNVPEGFMEYFVGFAAENRVVSGEGYNMGLHVYISGSVFGQPSFPFFGAGAYGTQVIHTAPKWEIKSFDSSGNFTVETSTQWLVIRFNLQ